MKVRNFTNSGFGMLVIHSEHYNENRCVKRNERKLIGVIVDKKFYDDPINGIICYPVVHWENSVMGHSCHPANIKPFRKNIDLPWVEVDN